MWSKIRGCILPFLSAIVIILLCAIIGVIAALMYTSLIAIKWHTKNGHIHGKVLYDREGGKFYAFQSIPYAKPPIGARRFMAPELADPWEGLLDATQDIPMCPQHDVDTGEPLGTEDCLYLNVYTPKLPIKGTTNKLKHVMVYIFGGGFIEGSATINMYGPHYLITQDVVIVTMNYRLGVLGFLSLEDSNISNNNGLKDQLLALKWVKNNIEDYGGDPNNITLFGHSSGAASTHYQILSPLTKGLFHRVIMQSGAATCSLATPKRNTAILLAEELGLQTKNLTVMLKWLRLAEERNILEAQRNIKWDCDVCDYWPGGLTIEGNLSEAIIPQSVHEVMNSGTFEKLPMLIGITSKEGLLTEVERGKWGITDFNIDLTIPRDLNKNYTSVIKDKMLQFYFPNNTNLNEISEDHLKLWSDTWINYCTITSARKHAEYGPVYFYEFTADTKLNYIKKMNAVSAKRAGVGHGDELAYIYKGEDWMTAIEPGSIEDVLSKRMVKIWTNFAKYGKPIVETDSLLDVNWLPADQNTMNYMEIGEVLKPGVFYNDSVDFWDDIYEEYGSSHKI